MNNTFKKGEIVYLVSGSPPLTITTVKGESVCVKWLNDKNKYSTAILHFKCLKKEDNKIEIDKKLINFAINHVIKSFMLNKQMGTFNTFLNTYEFSDDEIDELNSLIKNEELPSGYYSLCDSIGVSYYDTRI